MGHPYKSNVDFFLLVKIIFVQTLAKFSLAIINMLEDFWEPYSNHVKEINHIWSVWYQNRVKRVRGVQSWTFFVENIQKWRFRVWIFWKRSNCEAFFRARTLKAVFPPTFKGISIYVYIEESNVTTFNMGYGERRTIIILSRQIRPCVRGFNNNECVKFGPKIGKQKWHTAKRIVFISNDLS